MDEQFKKAQEHLFKTNPDVDNEVKLAIYAHFKQATSGKVTGSKPGRLQMVKRAKYEAWQKLGNMSQDEAKQKYIAIVAKHCPGFGQPSPKL